MALDVLFGNLTVDNTTVFNEEGIETGQCISSSAVGSVVEFKDEPGIDATTYYLHNPMNDDCWTPDIYVQGAESYQL